MAEGKPQRLCLQCQALSYELGVYFDDANRAKFGKKTPQHDPNKPQPSSAPPPSRIPVPVKKSPCGSYDNCFLDDMSPSELDEILEGVGGKRSASQSPLGSGQRKPKSPSTTSSRIPVVIPRKTTPKRTKSKSPSRQTKRAPSRAPRRRTPHS
ncbi:unnamed protein product [Clonostachys rhizophaga]|uniref:Uncharacterized protein n=1 Tax=Clonostachys rhizophaga TaxID=160324 RepID=A0A9N9YSK8_9HYPO|nr:unnamed protein product [Clonostachys rhizophaga]